MDELEKKVFTSVEKDVETPEILQAKYDAAARALFQISVLKPMEGKAITEKDRDEVARHRGILGSFAPELLARDKQFAERVKELIGQCNAFIKASYNDDITRA